MIYDSLDRTGMISNSLILKLYKLESGDKFDKCGMATNEKVFTRSCFPSLMRTR